MKWILLITAYLVVWKGFAQSAYLRQAQVLKQAVDAAYLRNQQQPQQTIEAYQQVRALYLRHNDLCRAAEIYLDLAAVQYDRGRYKTAIDLYRVGLADLPKSKTTDTSAFKFESALAENYRQLAQYDSSQYYFELAERRLTPNNVVGKALPVYVFAFYNNAGLLQKTYGDYPRCLLYFEKALGIARQIRSVDYLSYILGNTAALYQARGQYTQALALHQEALAHVRYDFERVMQWQQLGECYLALRQTAPAHKAFEQATRFFKQLKTRDVESVGTDFEIILQLHLGRLELATQRPEMAQGHFEKALQLSQSFAPNGKHPHVARAYRGLAEAAEQRTRPRADLLALYQQAICALHETFNDTDPTHNPPTAGISDEKLMFELLRRKAKLLQNTDLQASIDAYKTAMRLAEQVRLRYESADAKLFFTEQVAGIYAEAMDVCYELYRQAKPADVWAMAFDIAEQSRGAVMADALREVHIKPKTLPTAIRGQEQALKRSITQHQMDLLRLTDATKRTVVAEQLRDKLLAWSRLQQRMERQFGAYHQLKYQVKRVGLPQVKAQLLDEQTALVSYILGTKHLHVQVITSQTTTWTRVPLSPAFGVSVERLMAELRQAPGLKPYRGAALAAQLHAQLIRPIEAILRNKQRLIVLRDGLLHYLPFEILQSSSTGPYFTQQYAISYGASATLLCQSAGTKPSLAGTLLGMAPFAGTLRQAGVRDSLLRSLPASADEVRQIGGDVYVADRATKRQFLETYRSHGVIHLATHAQVNDADPMASFIAFYPDSTEYRLYSSELYDLSLQHTALVVLSACETGRGKIHRGEGMLSLGRAFQYAGCPSVISTLWNAHDQSSAYLAERLHKHLQAGKTIDVALQQARKDYFTSPIGQELDHPYYWANFVLMGQREALSTPHWSSWWWLSGGLLVLIIVWWYWQRSTPTNKKPSKPS